MSMPRIPGYEVSDREELNALRQRVANLFGSRTIKFPGAQPVSFAQKHLEELKNENYFVSEKADGIRCLMYTHVNSELDGASETFLIDRRNHFFYLQMGFPLPGQPHRDHFDTVLDGELILDTEPDGRETLRFLLFDCVIIDGKSLLERPYTSRLGYLKEHILKPYQQKLQKDPQYARGQCFRMDLKELQLSYGLAKVFEEIPKLKHGNDGIIFTSSVAPYTMGTCNKMQVHRCFLEGLKWKAKEDNTVDFKVTVEGSPRRYRIWLSGDRHSDVDKGILQLDPETEKKWGSIQVEGRIIECNWNPNWPNKWQFVRFRDDKNTANFVGVYDNIMETIENGVEKETVSLGFLTLHGFVGYEEMDE
ncbi:Dcp1p-Dcp2p decapping enzyme complex alpha subunit [Rhizophlyctis rosea]|uniref:mRNA guanylyltransferase n=1 Tax=Rhizophlyctis rosea TaxID=64517 RepID=A0AAD5S503_9FUNG|nr:Dcp1p-Dcp2p decapping enzyme complex alpha subunit [Rhizophlyctis rosea]